MYLVYKDTLFWLLNTNVIELYFCNKYYFAISNKQIYNYEELKSSKEEALCMFNNSIFSKDLCTYMKLEFEFIFMTFCFNLKELSK